MKNNNDSLLLLEKKLDELIARFEEQKGIIDSYIHKERESGKKLNYSKPRKYVHSMTALKKVKTDG